MKFKTYKLNAKNILERIDNNEINSSVMENLNVFELEVIKEYLEKQRHKIGIKSLGNEIRYSKEIQSQFGDFSDFALIKFTENKRSFRKIIIDTLINVSGKDIYFLILGNEFGKKSNLVDKTFITVNQFSKEMQSFFMHFEFKQELPSIFVIEFTGFDDFYVEGNKDFSTIIEYRK